MHRFGQHAFFQGDGFAGAHEFDVGGADICYDCNIGACNGSQWGDFARMIHPHFEDSVGIGYLRRKNRQRQANMVIQIPQGAAYPEAAGQHRTDHVLGGSLAIAATETDDEAVPLPAPGGGERLQGSQGILHQQHAGSGRDSDFMADQHGGSSGSKGSGRKVMGIKIGALQRHKKTARHDVAGVRANARCHGVRVA